MNIDDLTVGQAKELAKLFTANIEAKPTLYNRYIGKYVICRSRNEGINAGKVIAADDTGVILEDCRRLWYHKPAVKNASWYEGVAKYGINNESKVGEPVEKAIVEDYSLTLCTAESEKTLREAKSHVQN